MFYELKFFKHELCEFVFGNANDTNLYQHERHEFTLTRMTRILRFFVELHSW